MDDRRKSNRALWDAWTEAHASSEFYDVEGFRRGKTSLKPVELEELGEVAGLTMLHLQCHFGLDTLSWARSGATVTGVDFSQAAIDRARALAADLELPARFVCSDLFELPANLDGTFQRVFTSYGAIWWLDDLDAWAGIISRFLEPGGVFYIVEFHPLLFLLDEQGRAFEGRYLDDGEPLETEEVGSYAAPDADVRGTSYGWHHDLGTIVSALAGAGLRIEYLHEHPHSPYDCFPFTERVGPGRYAVRGLEPGTMPMLFSLRAVKP